MLQAGLVALLPVQEFYIQCWQEPVVRVLDGAGDWTDVEGKGAVVHIKDGRKVTCL